MKLLDLQDVLLVLGVVSVVGGVAMWSRPVALILFGLLCLADVLLIQAHDLRRAGKVQPIDKRKAS